MSYYASSPDAGTGGSLPAGVTLQPIEGGPAYLGKWTNSFPGGNDFYPLATFDQPLGYDAASGWYDSAQIAAYKNVGVNGFMSLYNGYNGGLIGAIRSQGMWVIGGPLAQGFEGNTLTGYVWTDEPDGNDRCGEATQTLREAMRERLRPQSRELLSFELGDILTHQFHDRSQACALWREHVKNYPARRFDSEVRRARVQLHCRP